MFIQRLNQEQLTELATEIVSYHFEFKIKDWNFYFNKIDNDHTVAMRLTLKNNPDNSIYLLITDFSVRILNNMAISTKYITKQFFMFMANTFGDEYKNAYIENCMKVFDND